MPGRPRVLSREVGERLRQLDLLGVVLLTGALGVVGHPQHGVHGPAGALALGGAAEDRGPAARRDKEAAMQAEVGDRISIPGRHVGDSVREGEVTEVRDRGGVLLYVVRWDDGHIGVCSPGPETRALHRTG